MAEHREVPSTDHDLLLRIWTVIEGTNGSGLITRFACLEKDVDEIKQAMPGLWTRREHDAAIINRKISGREWWLIAMSILGPIVAVVLGIILEHKK